MKKNNIVMTFSYILTLILLLALFFIAAFVQWENPIGLVFVVISMIISIVGVALR